MKKDPTAAPTARRIHKRGLMKAAHFSSSSKASGLMQLESKAEADAVAAMTVDPRVKWFNPQPFTFDLNTGRIYDTKDGLIKKFKGTGYKPRPYTPDFRVTLVSGEVFCLEVKNTRYLKLENGVWPHLQLLESFGYQLILITERELPEILAQNLCLLINYENVPVSEVPEGLLTYCETGVPFEDLRERFGISQAEVLTWILSGALRADLSSARLGPKSLISASFGCRKHLMELPI